MRTNHYPELMQFSNRIKIIIIALLLVFCVIASFVFQMLGTEEVYTHLYYIPITISCIWWPKKGIFIALLLSLATLIFHLIFRQQIPLYNDLIRSVIFIVTAVLVSKISISLNTAYKGLNLKNKALKEKEKFINFLMHKK